MGQQINFFFSDEDTQVFDQKIRGQLDFVVIKQPTRRLGLEPSQTTRFEADGEWLKVFLVRRCDLHQVRFKQVLAQRYWLVDDLRSPVVEYSRCFCHNGVLRRGRLFFDEGYFDEAGRWTLKPDTFTVWASSIIKFMQFFATKTDVNGNRIGPDAARLLADRLVKAQ